MQKPYFIFNREAELQTVKERLLNRRPFDGIALESMSMATQFDDYMTSETRGRVQSSEEELSKTERDDTNCSST